MDNITESKTRSYRKMCSREQAFDDKFLFKDIKNIRQIEELKLGDSILLADKQCTVIKNVYDKLEVTINYRYNDGPKQYSKRHLSIDKLKYLYSCYIGICDINKPIKLHYKECIPYDIFINDDIKYNNFDLERFKLISYNQVVMLYNQHFNVQLDRSNNKLYIYIPYIDENGNKSRQVYSINRIIYDYYKYMYYKYIK